MRGETPQYRSWIEELRDGEPPLAPFHWEIEFPEVFERENPGFDAIVGNPPFAGKNTVAAANVARYPDWLKQAHAESHGNADLVAHFFRRAFDLVRRNGAFGLIATNTIAQGDTRSSGLRWICEHGGEIYRARRRVKWPGLAAVVVSVLHVARVDRSGDDGRKAFDGGAHRPAHRAPPEGGKAADRIRNDTNDGANIAAGHPAYRARQEAVYAGSEVRDGNRPPAYGTQPEGRPAAGQAPDPDGANDSADAGTGRPVLRDRPASMFAGNKVLDGANVDTITAFLFHQGGHADPARLVANAGKSFQGSIVLGMGFTFDDTDKKGIASPLAEMRRLIEDDPRNREAIFPYIGGEEVNTSPTHAHHRYVINLRDYPLRREDLGESWDPGESGDVGESWAGVDDQRQRHPFRREQEGAGESWADVDEERRRELRRQPIVPHDYPEPVATDWPDLLAIVEERVKPERLIQKDKGGKRQWWLYLRPRPELHGAIAGLDRVLVIPQTSNVQAVVFLSAQMVFGHTLIIFPFTEYSAFALLQSRIHQVWSAFLGPTMKDDLRYTPSDCFETFPFPENWEVRPDLETVGKTYYDFRAALMVRNDEGLTRTYNRFHDPYENGPDIAELRDLHAAMDRAVLDAYGWNDVPTDCDFLLDHEIDEATWGRKKKPWRYRWPDAIRDEVLARLLALNAERAAEEVRAGTADRPKPTLGRPRSQADPR